MITPTRQVSPDTIELIQDILSGKVSPVDLAAAGKSASEGEAFSAAVSAASGLQAMGAVISKTVAKAAPPVFYASVADSVFSMRKELGILGGVSDTGGKLTDGTTYGALSTAVAGLGGLLGAAAIAGTLPVLLTGAAAAAIVGSAALGVAALASSKGDTGIYDAVVDMLQQAQSLAASMGDGLQKLFDQVGGAVGNGVEKFVDALFKNPEGLFPKLPSYLEPEDDDGPYYLDPETGYYYSNDPSDWVSIGNDAGEEDIQGSIFVPSPIDPLALDLDGDGIKTTGTGDAVVVFDLDGDGAKTSTGWVRPDNGWLVRDLNGNGTIDTGAELFDVNTVKRDGSKARDGFDALADLDANQDGWIDAKDAAFASLRGWKDTNSDSLTGANGLLTLAQAANQTHWRQAA